VSRHLPVITASELKSFRRCSREHHYAYDRLLRSAHEAQALRFGSLMHTALEMWWVGGAEVYEGQHLNALDYADMALRQAKADPFDYHTARALMVGYHARWAAEQLEVVAVEKEFRAALVNPDTGKQSVTYQLGGKLDALCKIDGRIYLVEHKTTSEECGPGSDYVRRLRLDGQVSLYYQGARALGYDVAGVVYDVIRKPGLRPYQVGQRRKVAETPEEYGARVLADIEEQPERYFQRHIVVRLEEEEREAMADVWATARAMREGELAGRYPRNVDACIRFGRACSFFDLCTGVATPQDNRFRVATRRHEELSQDPPNQEERAA
jgi:hypothetical protein